jgi:hypothetical protein
VVKQKKYQLAVDNEYNYDLVGICSHHLDYRLVWSLNDSLKLNLTKGKDLFVVGTKKGLSNEFPYYYSSLEDQHLEVFLIKNKHGGKYLIQEKQQIDYFLFLCNNFAIDVTGFVDKLRKIESVMIAYCFKPTDFQSTEYILF